MAPQAVRRVRRAGGKSAALFRGLLISIAATLAAVVVFSILISVWNIPDGVIRLINQVIKVGAIFLGVKSICPRGDENGLRRGALIGLLYMGIGVLCYALLTKQKITLLDYLIDVLMGVSAGGLSGMLLGSLRPRK